MPVTGFTEPGAAAPGRRRSRCGFADSRITSTSSRTSTRSARRQSTIRILLLRTGQRCVLQSRRGTDLTRAFPDLAAAALQQLPADTIVDGEAVVGVDGRLDFTQLQKRLTSPSRATALARAAPATFLAFGLLVLRGADLRHQPLAQRRQQLTAVLDTCHPPLQQVPFTLDRTQAATWLNDYAAAHVGVEGLVLKRVDEPYLGGRRRWAKLRHRDTAEAPAARDLREAARHAA